MQAASPASAVQRKSALVGRPPVRGGRGRTIASIACTSISVSSIRPTCRRRSNVAASRAWTWSQARHSFSSVAKPWCRALAPAGAPWARRNRRRPGNGLARLARANGAARVRCLAAGPGCGHGGLESRRRRHGAEALAAAVRGPVRRAAGWVNAVPWRIARDKSRRRRPRAGWQARSAPCAGRRLP